MGIRFIGVIVFPMDFISSAYRQLPFIYAYSGVNNLQLIVIIYLGKQSFFKNHPD